MSFEILIEPRSPRRARAFDHRPIGPGMAQQMIADNGIEPAAARALV
jgi:hypothetical protein